MQFLVDFLRQLLSQSSVRAAIAGAIINGLLYVWAAIAPSVAWIPDPSPVFFEVGKWIELLLAGWAASSARATYLAMRAVVKGK